MKIERVPKITHVSKLKQSQAVQASERCICPECGLTITHATKTPCSARECPRCGCLMRGALYQ